MEHPTAGPTREATIAALAARARELRGAILKSITTARSGHPGGSLSALDLVLALFEHHLRHDPRNPAWPGRDRFILSKGHAVPALYAVLAHRGYLPGRELSTLRQLGSRLQGHPVNRFLPAVEAPTGSLGQGLSVAIGLALAFRHDRTDQRVFCLMGDGEVQEGQVWEAAMSAAGFGLDNLVGILDANGGQIDGPIAQVMPAEEPLAAKWAAFGWVVREIDGNDHGQILDAYEWAKQREGKPKLILARTKKGAGVSFVVHPTKYHGMALTDEELARALAELGVDGEVQ